VLPNLVQEGDDGYLSVNYVALIPILINALQEQNIKIKKLESFATRLTMLETAVTNRATVTFGK